MTISDMTTISAEEREPAAQSRVLKASDKRRAQNRAAQKTYREKRKRRLQELEQLAAAAGLNTAKSASPESPPDVTDGSKAGSAEPSIPQLDNIPIRGSPGFTNSIADPTRLNSSLEPRVFELDNLESLDNLDSLDNYLDDAWVADLQNDITSTELTWPSLSPTIQTSFIDSQSASQDKKAPNSQITFIGSRSNSTTSNSPASSDDFFVFSKTYRDVADPYMNHLALQSQTTFLAAQANLLALGMYEEDPCAEDTLSIFYRPNLVKAQDSEAVVKAVQKTFLSIKPDLRPTRKQIMVKHPCYIDIMPFKDLRDRLIDLVTADPPMVDEDEFWQDMDGGGLMCWGSVSPGSGVAAGGGGAPWDGRSWEAKTWFLAKWSWVIGGEDSELARSSQWWRSMRGVNQGYSF
ncbi:hypothetical protein BT63DRAFT_422793 [Microthyrium microscopicum]|uniref:BZIP domain-containing protein n=1 Tax=Microthyrium microscopicum TaxID=703497 RepID=A0A6A6UN18_9PEZI|nr:hypothetical protein BT63DRAFT_422793 [Microthyrium microscopicum]